MFKARASSGSFVSPRAGAAAAGCIADSRIGVSRERGMVLLVTMMTVAILTFALASIVLIASNEYNTAFQDASWQESLYGSESGADLAMAALNSGSWTGWKNVGGAPPLYMASFAVTPPAGSAAIGPPAAGSYNYLMLTMPHGGEGNTQVTLYATIDAPAALYSSSGQGLRIRSTGIASLPGRVEVAVDDFDSALRKLTILGDRNNGGAALPGTVQPYASRVIEVCALPTVGYSGILVANSINMSGGGIIDSFNSSNPADSTNNLYDPAKRLSTANVQTTNSTGSNLQNTYVYGNLAYQGPAIQNTGNVQGTITSNFSATIPPVLNPPPSWTPTSGLSTINGNTTLTGGSQGAPARYKVSSINIPGGTSMVIEPSAPGVPSYVEIWCTGDFTTSGSGFITQQADVHVTYYVDGNITVSGNSFNNQTNIASNMMIYGVTPASGNNTLTVSGSGTFIGVIDAPAYNFTISGSASFSGALIGNTLNISGGASVHEDQALLSSSGSTYVVASWYEDSR